MDEEKKQGMIVLFMYFGIAIALIVAVVSSFVTAFNIIDYLLGFDETYNWYRHHVVIFDVLAGSVSFFLIAYSVLFYISRKVRLLTDNRFHTTVYYKICHGIILFVLVLSFLAVAISLAMLLTGLLKGDVSLNSLFKLLFVAGIGGMVFFYYRGVLRGVWRTHRKEERVFVGVCGFLVFLIISTSIFILNPFERKDIQDTFETLDIITAFSDDINAYHKRIGAVPINVNSSAFLDNEGVYREYQWEQHFDERFTYKRVNAVSYTVCASFKTIPSDRAKNSSGYPYGRFNIQETGEQCFTLDARKGNSSKGSE